MLASSLKISSAYVSVKEKSDPFIVAPRGPGGQAARAPAARTSGGAKRTEGFDAREAPAAGPSIFVVHRLVSGA